MTCNTKRLMPAAAISIALLLGGCAALGEKDLPAVKTYTIDAGSGCRAPRHFDATLMIAEPSVKRDMNTRSISYSDERYALEEYALTRWSDTPAAMLQRTIAENLDRSRLFRDVMASPVKCKSDYMLQSELFRFRQNFEGNRSYGILDIKFYLIDSADGHLVSSKMFRYHIPARTHDAHGAVDALNRAVSGLSRGLCRWISHVIREER
jgi:cholesterol transport system auxiliary component